MKEPYPSINRVSTASVHKGTGKHWKDWVAALDKIGARTMTHQEIVKILKTKFKLSLWWQQGVASGYEVAIGKRIEGQDAKGKYTLTVTKSLPCSAAETWKFLTSEKGLQIWLQPLSPVKIAKGAQFETDDGYFGEVRTLKVNRHIRITWSDPNCLKHTVVQIMIVARPKGKSILVFNHNHIEGVKNKALLRARWKGVVEGMVSELTL